MSSLVLVCYPKYGPESGLSFGVVIMLALVEQFELKRVEVLFCMVPFEDDQLDFCTLTSARNSALTM